MGSFWDQIKPELEGLEDSKPAARFGADYDSNPTVVKEVQTAINKAGYTPQLTVDGSYGPLTQAGIKWAQAANGLTEDGIIGDQTLGALGITPPEGTSVQSVTGAVKGAASAAVQALQNEFAALIAWAQKPTNAQPITQGSGVAPGFNATRASVVNSYVDWTIPFEGWTSWMYLDELGWITTGMGDKIDPIGQALSLPWKHPDGSTATPAEITAEWNAVDAHRTAPKGQQQNLPGGGSQGGWSTLRITKSDVQSMVEAMMHSNEQHILSGIPNFSQAPADAQLAVHSMSWAMGPGNFSPSAGGNYFKAFTEAFNAGDYATAASNSNMKGTGIDMRNLANKLLLTNAAQVRSSGFSPDHLYYLDFASLFTSGPLALLSKLHLPSLPTPASIIAAARLHPYRTGGIVAGVIAAVAGLFYLFGHGPKPPE